MDSPKPERRINCVSANEKKKKKQQQQQDYHSANGIAPIERDIDCALKLALNHDNTAKLNNICLNNNTSKERESMSRLDQQVDAKSKPKSQEQQKEQQQQQVSVATKEQEARLEQRASEGTKEQQADEPQTGANHTGPVKKFSIDCALYLIKAIISTYDLITWPAYYARHNVAARRREVDQVRSVQINANDPNSPWRQIDIEPYQIEIERQIDTFDTFDSMIKSSLIKFNTEPCFGYRQLLEERWVKRSESGDKLLRQVRLTDYKWCSYKQFDSQIEAARRGLLRDGVRAGQKVILFADTRAEWQITAQALLRLGAIVCTMYSTLGIDGIIHTCNETKAALVITQRDKVERLLKLYEKLPELKKIIYFDQSLHLPRQLGGDTYDEEYIRQQTCSDNTESGSTFNYQLESKIQCARFTQLLIDGLKSEPGDEHLAEENRFQLDKRNKDSLAVIMYTSGSTGIPKGVLISHGNIMETVKSFTYVTKNFVHAPRENVCTAYLPLAHIFEFCIESVMLYHGVRYGFATPHTLTDKSPGLVPGEKGDLILLKPTVMIIVPLILDRIVQGVKQTLKAGSYFKDRLVNYLIEYKSYWQQKQYETPLVDKIVCSKISVALGGRTKFVICGSAPLSGQTQTFVRSALNLKLPQGFGTTETCAATACQLFEDQSTQNVGLPVAGAQIKLEPWIEGNYRPEDKPNPRGEIVVGGGMIAHGYFNLEEQTKEAFYVDDAGVRWYRTGDIGEFLPNGQLKIIDRKKDLVKLQNGEYISLGRVESTLKSNPYTDNFCAYVNSNHNYLVALGPANELALKQLAAQIVDEHDKALKFSPNTAKRQGLPDAYEERQKLLLASPEEQSAMLELREILSTYQFDCLNNNETVSKTTIPPKSAQPQANDRLSQLCNNKLIIGHVLKFIASIAKERNLLSLEMPKKLLLIPEEWTEDMNLVTAALKIRRNFIYKRYEQELKQIYNPSKEQIA